MKLDRMTARSNDLSLNGKEAAVREIAEGVIANGGLDGQLKRKLFETFGKSIVELPNAIALAGLAESDIDWEYGINLRIIASALLHEKMEEAIRDYTNANNIPDIIILTEIAKTETGKTSQHMAVSGVEIYDPKSIRIMQMVLRQYEITRIIYDTEHIWSMIQKLRMFDAQMKTVFSKNTGTPLAAKVLSIQTANKAMIEGGEGVISRKLHAAGCQCESCKRGLKEISQFFQGFRGGKGNGTSNGEVIFFMM